MAADGDDPENKVKVISDLYGITLPRFNMRSARGMRESITKAAKPLHLQIETVGRREFRIPLLRKWGFRHEKATFSATIGGVYLQQARSHLTQMRIAVVCRKATKRVNSNDDRKLAISELRTPNYTGDDMDFKIFDPVVLGKLDRADVVEGYVLLIPPSVLLQPGMTLNDMRSAGCFVVDGGAKSEAGSARRL